MLKRHEFNKIKQLQAKDIGPTAISRIIGCDEKTVRRWMQRDHYGKESVADESAGKLDPFKEEIRARLHEFPLYTSQKLYQIIEDVGYTGGYTLVKDYVRQVRPPKMKAHGEYEWPIGECGQVDFGPCGLIRVGDTFKQVHVFVMVLSWSRMLYLEFVLRQSMEHFLACHWNAFEFFGSMPRTLRPDCCKTAVIDHTADGKPIYNPRYEDMAGYCGISLDACDPYSPYQKGQVENGIKYVKGNFLCGINLKTMTLDRVNAEARKWRDDTANVRNHRTTGQRPLTMFSKEKAYLVQLPINPYDCSVIKSVAIDKQARFAFESNRYSVPPTYASLKANLHILPDQLRVYYDGRLIASHLRVYEARSRPIVHPDHDRQFSLKEKKKRTQATIMRFIRLDPVAEDYYKGLERKQLNAAHHVRKILAIADQCDHDALVRALRDAHESNAYSSDYIANLVTWRKSLTPLSSPLHLQRHEDLLELTFEESDIDLYQKCIPNQKDMTNDISPDTLD